RGPRVRRSRRPARPILPPRRPPSRHARLARGARGRGALLSPAAASRAHPTATSTRYGTERSETCIGSFGDLAPIGRAPVEFASGLLRKYAGGGVGRGVPEPAAGRTTTHPSTFIRSGALQRRA